MQTRKLWLALCAVIGISFAVLIYYGRDIYLSAPPIPASVTTADGQVLFTGQDIKDGQNIWQSIGGQTVGSIWGHGSYIAPDWNADYLHREANFILDKWAVAGFGKKFEALNEEQKAYLTSKLQQNIRTNTFDKSADMIVLTKERAEAFEFLSQHYTKLFMNDPSYDSLRNFYAIPVNTIKEQERMQKMNAFFFWTSWVCSTVRPGEKITYTNNWPADDTIGNKPASSLVFWTGFSVIILLAGVGLLIFYYAKNKEENHVEKLPATDPLRNIKKTDSMKATLKYFRIVSALIIVQILAGIITAHYGVEGNGLFGFPLSKFLPESVSRSWHVQLAIFWIATSWLATGLYMAPLVSGYEPKYQKLGVNVLFGALIVVVGGSLLGEWLGIMQKFGLANNFLWGHQGYEYLELGRVWQILLLAGLVIWLVLMLRALMPALKQKNENRHLLLLFIISSVAIALFYSAGLMYGRQTHLAIAEYWRWWVVHLWVEGFFEVFATVVSAFIFSRMGLLNIKSATTSVLFATIIFLAGGILGTFHHLYFTATPTAVLALGASFSALEVVPLVLIGHEALHNYKVSKSTPWISAYKWPIYCFIAVAFWNFLGAGIFGFIINPPIALYYMQGLNTTPVHGHAALFGVYGMLGIGLMLFALRGLTQDKGWQNKGLRFAFWSMNIGLLLMVVGSLLPIGLLQVIASVEKGYWYARSAEFLQTPTMQMLRWLRVPGDVLFAIGCFVLVVFVFKLKPIKAGKEQPNATRKTKRIELEEVEM
jgi:nitric oxide reductase subunit B